MTGFSRPARSTDFGWLDALPALVLIAALFLGGDWAGEAVEENDAARMQRTQALAVALGGANALSDLSFDELQPTTGYVPLPHHLHDAPIAANEPGHSVQIRVSDVDVDGHLRRIEVRVGYTDEDGGRAFVETATVRQDWAATHADRDAPRRTAPGRLAS